MYHWMRTRMHKWGIVALAVVGALVLRAVWYRSASAHGPTTDSGDVIVGAIQDQADSYGSQNGVSAFSVGTTSCNIGTKALDWFPEPEPNHPVIAQNVYRVRDGRIEQIGLSWVKHGFFALNESLCGPCQGQAGNHLAVNCSDPYTSGLNGSQGNIGPRSQVNVATAQYVLPFRRPIPPGAPPDKLAGRLQIKDLDLDPAQNVGAKYYVEAQYVHPQDAAGGKANNNASYRPAAFPLVSGTFTLMFDPAEPTVQKFPAIYAWKAQHPDVQILPIDIPNDGRLILGIRSIPKAAGGFHHELALHNLNSDRSAQSLTVKTASGSVSNPGFHCPQYFGETYSGDDWAANPSGADMSWSARPPADPANTNAVRWGTLYSFWFDSETPANQAVIGLFKPGQAGDPAEIRVALGGAPRLVAQAVRNPAGWLADQVRTDHAVEQGKPLRLLCRKGADVALEGVSSSNPNIQATISGPPQKDAHGQIFWDVTVEPKPLAKPGYFESILTFKSKAQNDREESIRVYGQIPEK